MINYRKNNYNLQKKSTYAFLSQTSKAFCLFIAQVQHFRVRCSKGTYLSLTPVILHTESPITAKSDGEINLECDCKEDSALSAFMWMIYAPFYPKLAPVV